MSMAEPGPINSSVSGFTIDTGIFLNTVALPFSSTKVCPAFGIQFVTAAPNFIFLSVAISPTTLAFPQLPAAPSMTVITFLFIIFPLKVFINR